MVALSAKLARGMDASVQSFLGRRQQMTEKRLYLTAFIYFVGVFLTGVVWWKALIVAAAAALCWYVAYGRRIIIGVGVLIFLLGLVTWAGLVPAPSEWGHLFEARRS